MRLPDLLLVLTLLIVTPRAAEASTSTQPAGVWPLHPDPSVVHEFDPPDVAWAPGHRGVDLLGTIGQRVRASLPGRVSFVGSIAGVGIVVVAHGTVRTTYQPVKASVARGAQINAGDALGTLEWYGTHCLPAACLHWGLIEGDRYLDPLTLVGGPRPVRLLPLEPAPTPLAQALFALPW